MITIEIDQSKILLNDMISEEVAMHREKIISIIEFKDQTGIEVVYIAGKVTGLPYRDVAAKFLRRQLELEALGYIVINPCNLIAADEDWLTAMKICLYIMPFADHINLLHDWQDSNGATIEKELAEKLGLNLLTLENTVAP